jgi:prepilin signal peptidase PulO-like enzyme (type II secretory pathway)
MTFPIHLTSVGAIVVGAIASYTDIRTTKIYNWLTFPAAGLGVVARAVEYGMAADPSNMMPHAMGGALNGVAGWLTGVALVVLLKVLLRLGKIGHGDTKLMGALGAWIGPGLLCGAFLYYCVFYSVFTILWMASAFPWNAYLATKNLKALDLTKFNEVRKTAIPMAPFITAGLLVAIFFEHQTLVFFGMAK